jgi:hypothetical protein
MLTLSLAPFRQEGQRSTCRPEDDYSALALGIQFPVTGNATQLQVFAFANISKSQAYLLGIVPKYGSDGTLIPNDKNPPFPWVRMPEPVIKTGKKLFDAAEIRAWRDAIRDRARQATLSCASGGKTQREVMP